MTTDSNPVHQAWSDKNFLYSATVVRVIDGDTVVLDLDLGCHVTLRKTVRLRGINAPELSTPAGLLSKTFMLGTLPVGLLVVVQTFLDKDDKYGRLLGDVWLDGGSVASLLVERGYAVRKEY